VVRLTGAAAYEAHPSVAVDAANRVWIAWEEAEAHWGKDSGVLGGIGPKFLEAAREVRLVRYENGRLLEPAAGLRSSVPLWMSSMHQLPKVAIGPGGIPYVFFRHYLHRIPMPEDEFPIQAGDGRARVNPWHDTARTIWDTYVTAFDGAKWLPARELAETTGRNRIQTAAVTSGGKLVYVWPADGRTYQAPRVATSQLRFLELDDANSAAEGGLKPYVVTEARPDPAAVEEQAALKRVRETRWSTGAGKPLRLFRGDLHRHTDISADSQRDADLIDTFRYAMDPAALDFLAITDHTGHQRHNYFHYDWWRTRQVTSLFNNPGYFAALYGYERTVGFPGGHRNIISTRRDLQPFRIADEEFTGLESYGARLFPYLKLKGDIAIPHTTATAGGTTFRENDPAAEPVVEIFQGLRGSYEEPNTPSKGSGAGSQYAQGFVWNAWRKGLRLGVIASSDHYSTHQSYACVYAPALAAEAIHAALRNRRTYAATDNIIVKFQAAAPDGAVRCMGEEFKSAADPEFQVEVRGTAPIERLELIGNGRILLARRPGAGSDRFSYRDRSAAPGNRYYYVRIVQANRHLAWSSPIWVAAAQPAARH
jgi:Protein of unknown function (DUF3604)